MIAAYINRFRRWLAKAIAPDPVIVDLRQRLNQAAKPDARYDPKQFRRPR